MDTIEILFGTPLEDSSLLGKLNEYETVFNNMVGNVTENKKLVFESLYVSEEYSGKDKEALVALKNQFLCQYIALPVPLQLKFQEIGIGRILMCNDSELENRLAQIALEKNTGVKLESQLFSEAIEAVKEELQFLHNICQSSNKYNAIDGYTKLLAHKYNVSNW